MGAMDKMDPLVPPLVINGKELIAAGGSILDYRGDCIVNAANTGGVTGFGLDELVNRRCGPDMKRARRSFGGIPTGTARSTPSFLHGTHVRWVIHATGPVFRKNSLSGDTPEKKYLLLRNAYANSIREASRLGCDDVGFCLLSCGVFRGEEPLGGLILAGLEAILESCINNRECPVRKVVVVAYTDEERAALAEQLDALKERKAAVGQVKNESDEGNKTKWTELMKDSAWVVEELLTGQECERLLQRAADLDIQNRPSPGDRRHRDSTTVAFDDAELSTRLFERIKGHLPQEVWVDEDCSNPGLRTSRENLYGRWMPYGLNHRWRVACYPGRGHFGPHRDGCHVANEHRRSLLTINGFLTDRPPGFGGATRFLRDEVDASTNQDGIFSASEGDVLRRVEAERAGTATVFFHDLMHDGEPLAEGSPPKWLFRADVMYERDPGSVPELSEAQRLAREYLSQAEDAENEGDVQGATVLYKRAYRLDPDLELAR